MGKLTGTICVISLLILGADSHNDKFKKLRSVEAYEVQPAILITPTYSAEGGICSVAIEKRHVSSKGVDLDAEMSAEQIHQFFDQIAPHNDRGQPAFNRKDDVEITTIEGPTLVTSVTYDNISLRMYGRNRKSGGTGYVAAVIQWKKEGCS